ncbi:MAG: twin-arginine translocase subunit TatC [Ktedonobacteraceae bacterium]|nr:twin-arginine translocase subunit TatC [Ktedonobacteraceae bacterium]
MATGNIDQDQMSAQDTILEEEEETEGMTLVEHLEELRWRIIKSLLAIAVGAIVAFIFREPIMQFLQSPLPKLANQFGGPGHGLTVTGIGEGFTVTLLVSLAAGFIIALPVTLYQTWAFISPGLYEREKKHAVPFILLGIALFVAGISLGFFVLRYPVEWLVSFASSSFNELITAGSYFHFVAFFLLAFGVIFELPLVLTFLARIELITVDTLKKKRSVAHIGMWLAAAFIMPGADPYSPIILGVAMSCLYELTILFIKFFIKPEEA